MPAALMLAQVPVPSVSTIRRSTAVLVEEPLPFQRLRVFSPSDISTMTSV